MQNEYPPEFWGIYRRLKADKKEQKKPISSKGLMTLARYTYEKRYNRSLYRVANDTTA